MDNADATQTPRATQATRVEQYFNRLRSRPGAAPVVVAASARGAGREAACRRVTIPGVGVDELVIEVDLDASRRERAKSPVPEYVHLALMAERGLPGHGLGSAALAQCFAPTDAMAEEARKYVSTFGLLQWDRSHSCAAELSSVCQIFPSAGADGGPPPLSLDVLMERLRPLTDAAYAAGGEAQGDDRLLQIHRWIERSTSGSRRANCVAWLFVEGLMMLRAVKLWTALKEMRSAKNPEPLKALWDRPRGGRTRLFDSDCNGEPLELGPANGLAELLTYSVSHLAALINDHITSAMTLLIPVGHH